MAERQISLMKLVDPEFLSLVTTPANQTGFKIIRNAEEAIMSHTDRNPRIRPKIRSDSLLLSITLPTDIDEDEAKELMDAFSLGSDYELYTNMDGTFMARRIGSADEEGVSIDLGNGFYASVQASATTKRSDSTIAGVTLVGMEFDENFLTVEAVRSWLEGNEINFKPNGVEVHEGGFSVTRHDVPEGVGVRKVRIDVGVTGLVTKTKNSDVPAKVYRSVVEETYGNWGWGHLNFLSAVADPVFTRESWNAIDILHDVLTTVILYSGLPLDERKTLVQNALSQFTSYINDLMDALPREVTNQARADRKPKQQETPDMTKPTEETLAARTDDAAPPVAAAVVEPAVTEAVVVPAEAAATPAQASDKGEGFVTRADMEAAITAAVEKALETQKAARSDSSSEVLGAIQSLADSMKIITRSVEEMKKEVDEVAGTTLTRSAPAETHPSEEGTGKAKRSDSPFEGMFGSRFGK